MTNSWPFQSLLGQPYAVGVLLNALSRDQAAAAYLFVGANGVGKASAARQFAKALCGIESEEDTRNHAIDAGNFADVREIGPKSAGRDISIAQLWPRDGNKDFRPENALLRDLSYEPIAGRKRVFIIKDAEGLNEASGNSLLKTLEEPPPYSHLVLTAASDAAVLPTILSRCVTIRFYTIPPSEIERALIERFDVAPAHARFLALYSEGRLGRAVSLSRSPALLTGRDQILDLARDLVTAPQVKSFKLSEDFRKLASKLKVSEEDSDSGDGEEKASRAAILRGFDLLATYLRDLLVIRSVGGEAAHPINADRRAELVGAARHFTPRRLEEGLALLTALRAAVDRNGSIPLAVDLLFARLTAQRT